MVNDEGHGSPVFFIKMYIYGVLPYANIRREERRDAVFPFTAKIKTNEFIFFKRFAF